MVGVVEVDPFAGQVLEHVHVVVLRRDARRSYAVVVRLV